MRCERAGRRWQPQRDDQIAGLKRVFALRRVAGQTIKRLERDLAPAGPALDLDDGVERDQRHAEIRRVRGDAGLAPAEHSVKTVLAMAGIATRARFAFVAGACGIVEISAAGSLQQIAADGRGIAKLGGCAGQQRLGHRRIGLRKVRIVREVGIADQRADADAAIGQMFDTVEPGQPREVDETVRAGDAALHQVEQIGA